MQHDPNCTPRDTVPPSADDTQECLPVAADFEVPADSEESLPDFLPEDED